MLSTSLDGITPTLNPPMFTFMHSKLTYHMLDVYYIPQNQHHPANRKEQPHTFQSTRRPENSAQNQATMRVGGGGV